MLPSARNGGDGFRPGSDAAFIEGIDAEPVVLPGGEEAQFNLAVIDLAAAEEFVLPDSPVQDIAVRALGGCPAYRDAPGI